MEQSFSHTHFGSALLSDKYLKSVVQREDRFTDRLEGGKRREFRCPLCQRLSNCLIPFVDVGEDWLDAPNGDNAPKLPMAFTSEDEPMSTDSVCSGEERHGNSTKTSLLHDFLSTSKWWSRNDTSVDWDGQSVFIDKSANSKPDVPILSSPRQSLRKIQSKFGKKELIGAWNSVLKTPRLVRRRARSMSAERPGITKLESEPKQRESNSDVLRRFMDQVSDVAHRADIRRLGEDELCNDFGEFRHYLNEKAAYNKANRAAGKELVDVSYLFISPSYLDPGSIFSSFLCLTLSISSGQYAYLRLCQRHVAKSYPGKSLSQSFCFRFRRLLIYLLHRSCRSKAPSPWHTSIWHTISSLQIWHWQSFDGRRFTFITRIIVFSR